MTSFATTTSQSRVKLVLCCSAAFLLSACGGTADQPDYPDNQQALAATTVTDSGASAGSDLLAQTPDQAAPAADAAAAPMMDASAPASTDAAPAPASTHTPSGDGKGPSSNEFNLNGYQDNAAASSDAGSDGTTVTIGADGQQATQPPAV